MVQRSFLRGAFILMSTSLINRILGFAYNIFASRLLGAEGLGLYRFVWPILGLMLTFVTAGLPMAISKLVAEALVHRDKIRVKRILTVSATVVFTMAIICTALMWFGRGFVKTHWLSDPNAYPTYLASIPIVSVIAVSAILRGYFQGLQDMGPWATAQIVEQIVRIVSIYFIATKAISHGLAYAAAAAMVGMLCGELSGLAMLIYFYYKRARLDIVLPTGLPRSMQTTRETLWSIAQLAVPVTLSRLVWNAIWTAEPVLIMRTLAMAGVTTAAATAQYGQYDGMVWPLLGFAGVFTSSLTINLVPSVSESAAERNPRRIQARLAQSWKAAALVGFPAAVVLTLFAEPLCRIIYNQPTAGAILAIMAPTSFLICLQAPLSGILQGLNHAGLTMGISITGGIVRLGLIWVLGPSMGIMGVAWATVASICLTATLYFAATWYYVGFSVRIVDTAKIAIAAMVMLIAMTMLTRQLTHIGGLQLIGALLFGSIIYFGLCGSLRVLTTRSLARIPRIGVPLAKVVSWLPFAV